jgi:hypothetical protein
MENDMQAVCQDIGMILAKKRRFVQVTETIQDAARLSKMPL